MGIRYLSVSVASTALSFVGLQVWTELSLDRLRADGLIAKNISLGDSEHALELLLGSYFTIALLTNFVLNVYILLILSLKVRVKHCLPLVIIAVRCHSNVYRRTDCLIVSGNVL